MGALLLPHASAPVDRATESQAGFLYSDGSISIVILKEGHYMLGLLGNSANFLIQDSFRYAEPFLRRGPAEGLSGGLMPVDAKACESSVLLVLVGEEQVPLCNVDCTMP